MSTFADWAALYEQKQRYYNKRRSLSLLEDFINVLDAGDGVKNQLEALADDVEGDGNWADASKNSCVAAMRRVESDMEEQITSLNNLKEHLEQVLEELEKQTAREMQQCIREFDKEAKKEFDANMLIGKYKQW